MVRLRGAIGTIHKISVNGWTMAVPRVDQGTSGTPASTVITSPGQSTAGCQKPSDIHGSFNSYRESVIDGWVSRAPGVRLSSDAFESSADELASKLDVWLGETVSALRELLACPYARAALHTVRAFFGPCIDYTKVAKTAPVTMKLLVPTCSLQLLCLLGLISAVPAKVDDSPACSVGEANRLWSRQDHVYVRLSLTSC
jgi:hypothetical protein